MKTRLPPRGRQSAGYAMLLVMIIAACCVLVFASTISRTVTTVRLNDRNNQYTAGLYAAEAATEKVIARMKSDFPSGGNWLLTNNLTSYKATVPTTAENAYWGNFQFSDAQGNANQTYVQCISATGWGPLSSQYAGLNGWTNIYRVLSNAKSTGSTGATIVNAVQQDIQFDSIPVFQFAIFYNSLLEFTWCAPFIVNGRTHANGSIYVGSCQNLTFNSAVTCSGWLGKTNWDGKTTSQYTGALNYNGSPGYSTNAQVLQLPIGTNNTPAAVQQIINMPPAGEDPNSAMGQQRYYNKAEIVLLVSNSTVTATLKTSASDASPTVITGLYSSTNYNGVATNFPFLTLTNPSSSSSPNFTDQRESKTVVTTQIDIGKLNQWIATNSRVKTKFPSTGGVFDPTVCPPPNILYVADNRTNSSSQLPAVRLIDGSVIPTNMVSTGPSGFTVATPNPLYVLGNYNCPDSGALNGTNTSKTFPASLVSDALTILSGNWADSHSGDTFSSTGARAWPATPPSTPPS